MAKPTIDELIKFCQDQFKYHINRINDLEHSTTFLAYPDVIDLSRLEIGNHHIMKDKFRAMEEYLTEYRDWKNKFSEMETMSIIGSPEYDVEVFKEELKKELKNSIVDMNADGDDEYCRGWRNGIREAGRFIDINDEDFSQFEPHKITPTEEKKPLSMPMQTDAAEKNVSEHMISYNAIDWCNMISDMFESSYSLDCYDEGNDTRVIDLNDLFNLMIKYVYIERSDKNGN